MYYEKLLKIKIISALNFSCIYSMLKVPSKNFSISYIGYDISQGYLGYQSQTYQGLAVRQIFVKQVESLVRVLAPRSVMPRHQFVSGV